MYLSSEGDFYIRYPTHSRKLARHASAIRKITTHKKRFLDLLLLADEQESMIDRYLERGEMFVARDDGQVVAECVVTDEADRIGEIKNLAVPLQYQRKGYGRQTLEFLEAYYRERYRTLLVGTGDVPRTLRFTNDADTFARTRSPASSPIITTTPSSRTADNW